VAFFYALSEALSRSARSRLPRARSGCKWNSPRLPRPRQLVRRARGRHRRRIRSGTDPDGDYGADYGDSLLNPRSGL